MNDSNLMGLLNMLMVEQLERAKLDYARSYLLDVLNKYDPTSAAQADSVIQKLLRYKEAPLEVLDSIDLNEHDALDLAMGTIIADVHECVVSETMMSRPQASACAIVLLVVIALHLRGKGMMGGVDGNVGLLSAITMIVSWQGYAQMGIWAAILCGLRDRRLTEGLHFDRFAIDGNLVAACTRLRDAVVADREGIIPIDLAGIASPDAARSHRVNLELFREVLFPVDVPYSVHYLREPTP